METTLARDAVDAVGRLVHSLQTDDDAGFDEYCEAIEDLIGLWPLVEVLRPTTHSVAA